MMQELNYIRCGDYYIPDIRLPSFINSSSFWTILAKYIAFYDELF